MASPTSILLRAASPLRKSIGSRYLVGPLLRFRTKSTLREDERYWDDLAPWKSTSTEEFLSHRFQIRYTVNTKEKLYRFLNQVLPDVLDSSDQARHQREITKEEFIEDVYEGLKKAPMALKLTPHILSRINWNSPLDDPVRRQFLPVGSRLVTDHPELTLDSLHEQEDSPVPGLVHRYPGRALFLAMSICPVYCRFCTRAWSVGANTETLTKTPQKPSRNRWEAMFEYIEERKDIQDLVVSGGDGYQLTPDQLKLIGERLLSIPHVRRFRLATKGMAVAPGRILDKTDPWIDTVISLSQQGRQMGKQVCLHTHFNHPQEINWVTEKAANKLFQEGVIVRNQSVLLRGVNDDHETMGTLIKKLADINIQPYYVYQCDLTRGIEDLRTPLKTIIDLDKRIRGTISGFMMPSFVVDLPGGGGKRLASTCEDYDETTGVSYWTAPGLDKGKEKQVYTYFDPYPASWSAEEVLRRHAEIRCGVDVRLRAMMGTPESNNSTPPAPEATLDRQEQPANDASTNDAVPPHSVARSPSVATSAPAAKTPPAMTTLPAALSYRAARPPPAAKPHLAPSVYPPLASHTNTKHLNDRAAAHGGW